MYRDTLWAALLASEDLFLRGEDFETVLNFTDTSGLRQVDSCEPVEEERANAVLALFLAALADSSFFPTYFFLLLHAEGCNDALTEHRLDLISTAVGYCLERLLAPVFDFTESAMSDDNVNSIFPLGVLLGS